jgi:hypothetical protein
MVVGPFKRLMIVSVKPAGSVADLAALAQQTSNNEATTRTVLSRLVVRRLAGTPTAEENFMLVYNLNISNWRMPQAALIGVGR